MIEKMVEQLYVFEENTTLSAFITHSDVLNKEIVSRY